MDDNTIDQRIAAIREELIRQRNKSSRVEGRASQDKAKKLLDIPDNPYTKSSEEENWNSPIRWEVKSGKQVSNTTNMFEKAESQSWEHELSKKLDDQKKLFGMIMMPHGTSDGLFLCRLSQIKDIVIELSNIWKEQEEE
tara:strand:+ start:963 stop:1379 length:417 start_codon:yes stop_codon:yes gene_type:complete